MVGIGNLIGPLLAAVFAEKASWRILFYILCPVAAMCCCICGYYLPSNMPKGNFKDNVKKIDYWGVITVSFEILRFMFSRASSKIFFAIMSYL